MRTAAAIAALFAVSLPFGVRAQNADPGSTLVPAKRFEAEPVDPGTPLLPADAAHHSPPTDPMPSPPSRDELSPQAAGGLAIASPILLVASGSVVWKLANGNDYAKGVGAGLILAGLWVGPSAGHMYAGEWGHAIGWSLFRAVTSTLGAALVLAASIHSSDCQGSQCDTSTSPLALGLVLVVAAGGSAIYDLVDAPSAAERTNKRLAATDLALAPMLSAGASGGSMRGLAVVARF